MAKASTGLKMHFARSMLTHSLAWGDVWRVDFTFPDNDPGYGVDRAVCWLPPHQQWQLEFAIGQRIPPLR